MRANPMTFSADTASTHVGWRQSGSDADADHLLIRSDWGASGSGSGGGSDPANPRTEPVLCFLGDTDGAGTASPAAHNPSTDNPAAHHAPTAAALDSELEVDVEVNDAAVDAPPYLWGGEALVPDSVSSPDETVFS